MSVGDWIALGAIILYLIIAVAYGCSRQGWQTIYYLAAAVLNLCVLMMSRSH